VKLLFAGQSKGQAHVLHDCVCQFVAGQFVHQLDAGTVTVYVCVQPPHVLLHDHQFQTHATGQAAFVFVHEAVVPPLLHAHDHDLVVPQAFWLLSHAALHAVHDHAVALHTPFTGVAQAAFAFVHDAVVPPLLH
jgi:hypothetical protein